MKNPLSSYVPVTSRPKSAWRGRNPLQLVRDAYSNMTDVRFGDERHQDRHLPKSSLSKSEATLPKSVSFCFEQTKEGNSNAPTDQLNVTRASSSATTDNHSPLLSSSNADTAISSNSTSKHDSDIVSSNCPSKTINLNASAEISDQLYQNQHRAVIKELTDILQLSGKSQDHDNCTVADFKTDHIVSTTANTGNNSIADQLAATSGAPITSGSSKPISSNVNGKVLPQQCTQPSNGCRRYSEQTTTSDSEYTYETVTSTGTSGGKAGKSTSSRYSEYTVTSDSQYSDKTVLSDANYEEIVLSSPQVETAASMALKQRAIMDSHFSGMPSPSEPTLTRGAHEFDEITLTPSNVHKSEAAAPVDTPRGVLGFAYLSNASPAASELSFSSLSASNTASYIFVGKRQSGGHSSSTLSSTTSLGPSTASTTMGTVIALRSALPPATESRDDSDPLIPQSDSSSIVAAPSSTDSPLSVAFADYTVTEELVGSNPTGTFQVPGSSPDSPTSVAPADTNLTDELAGSNSTVTTTIDVTCQEQIGKSPRPQRRSTRRVLSYMPPKADDERIIGRSCSVHIRGSKCHAKIVKRLESLHKYLIVTNAHGKEFELTWQEVQDAIFRHDDRKQKQPQYLFESILCHREKKGDYEFKVLWVQAEPSWQTYSYMLEDSNARACIKQYIKDNNIPLKIS